MRSPCEEPAAPPPWWLLLLGGIGWAAATFVLLWSLPILLWWLEAVS